jgi:HK97 family phage prohead protease/HK97 family phage major capsid protein
MTILNKVFHLDSQFVKELPSADEKIDSIFISGYASANSVDRSGDVIPSSVWEKGMLNYLANPIILAHHDHDDPIGRMIEHKVDGKGLWIKARISAAAEIFNLIKDGVVTAFSVGFRVIDAEYNAAAELFVIKELELIEISVVSVPCNQDTLFSLSKSFESDDDYKSFKLQFVPKSESAKGLESSTETSGITLKEIGMGPKELQAMLDAAAQTAATNATKALLDAQAKAKADADAQAAADAAMQERINKAVAAVTPSTTGAEKLLAEVTARVEAMETSGKKTLADLEASIKEKADELAAIQKSKMTFAEGKNSSEISYEDKEKAVLLSKMSGKSIESTKFGRDLLAKAVVGGKDPSHMASVTWELEVSMNMESEVRRRLVAAPLFRQIAMQTNVMTIPLNPEAGYGTWVTNTQFGTTASPGAAQTHQLKEITLNSYKLATTEYLMYEEEEDSLILLLPIIRDAMVRRVAKSVDKAFLLGAGAGADPVKGIATYDATSTLTQTNTTAFSVANLRTLRKNLGVWGLEPDNVTFLVSNDAYFDLLEDTTFMTMDKVGSKATILTGQVGMVGNSPVIVSAELHNKITGSSSTTTNIGAIAVATSNFVVGNQRGLRFDTQDLVETQRKVMVASLRTGMTQLTTNIGIGADVFRWT